MSQSGVVGYNAVRLVLQNFVDALPSIGRPGIDVLVLQMCQYNDFWREIAGAHAVSVHIAEVIEIGEKMGGYLDRFYRRVKFVYTF